MRHSRHTLAACAGLAAALAPPAPAGAQRADTVVVAPGALVRVRQDGDSVWRTGYLVRGRPDSLTVRWCEATCYRARYARSAALRLEARRGLPGSRAQRIAAGMAAGALAGVGVLALGVWRCEVEDRRSGRSEGPGCGIGYVATPAFAAAGLVVGGFVGAGLPPARWRPAVVSP